MYMVWYGSDWYCLVLVVLSSEIADSSRVSPDFFSSGVLLSPVLGLIGVDLGVDVTGLIGMSSVPSVVHPNISGDCRTLRVFSLGSYVLVGISSELSISGVCMTLRVFSLGSSAKCASSIGRTMSSSGVCVTLRVFTLGSISDISLGSFAKCASSIGRL